MSRCPTCGARPMWADPASGWAKCAPCDRTYAIERGEAPAPAPSPPTGPRVRVAVTRASDDYRDPRTQREAEVVLPPRGAPPELVARLLLLWLLMTGSMTVASIVAAHLLPAAVGLSILLVVTPLALRGTSRPRAERLRFRGDTLVLPDGREVPKVRAFERRVRVAPKRSPVLVYDLVAQAEGEVTLVGLTPEEVQAVEEARTLALEGER